MSDLLYQTYSALRRQGEDLGGWRSVREMGGGESNSWFQPISVLTINCQAGNEAYGFTTTSVPLTLTLSHEGRGDFRDLRATTNTPSPLRGEGWGGGDPSPCHSERSEESQQEVTDKRT